MKKQILSILFVAGALVTAHAGGNCCSMPGSDDKDKGDEKNGFNEVSTLAAKGSCPRDKDKDCGGKGSDLTEASTRIACDAGDRDKKEGGDQSSNATASGATTQLA
ncbi:MAG: hypothetical protein ACLFS4_08965 [Opitutales bacterium]